MKRRISLLLAVVMVLGSFGAVFATDVSTTEEAAAQFLNERDILLGNTSGDLALDKYMKRQDSVIMLSRLMGKEDAAKDHIVTEAVKAFKDVKNPYYKAFISWAVEEEYFKGKTPTKFGNDEDITARDYAVVLLRALGHGEEVATGEGWKNAFETATKLGLVKDLELKADDKIRRGQMAVMTVNALNTKVNDGDKTLAEELGIDMSMPVGDVEVKAVSQKEIEVKFANKIDEADQKKAEFVVTNDKDRVITLNPIKWNKAGDTVTINRTAKLNFVPGKYTVEIKGLDLENNKFEVEIDKSKNVAIEIKENVVNNENNTELTVEYVDQYGAKTKVSSAQVAFALESSVAGATMTVKNADGKFVVEPGADGKKPKAGDVLTVTIVDAADPTNVLQVTKELEVVDKSVIADVELETPFAIDKNNKVTDEIKKDTEVYAKINAQDQYGKDIEFKDIKKAITDKSLEVKATPAISDVEVEEFKNKAGVEDGIYLKFKSPGAEKKYNNTVSLYTMQVFAAGVSTSNVVSYEVLEDAKAAALELVKVSSEILTVGKGETVEFKVFDQYGKEMKTVNEKVINVKLSKNIDKDVTTKEDATAKVSVKDNGNGKFTITANKKFDSGDITFQILDGDKVLSEETLNFAAVDAVESYKAEVKTKGELVAGDNVAIEVEAQNDGKLYDGYNGTQNATITLKVGTETVKVFRELKFNDGVAKVTVPAQKSGKVTAVTVNIDKATVTVAEFEEITVKAAAHTKFILENNNTILATDEFDNVVESYTGAKTGKLTSKNDLSGVAEIDAEGTLMVEFKDGKATLSSELEAGKYTIELGGITSELEVPAAK